MRLKTLEDSYSKTVQPKLDKIETHIESYQEDHALVVQSFSDMRRDMTSLKASIAQNTALIYATNEKINACEELCDQLCVTMDNLGQYTRRESLEFHGIPIMSDTNQQEDTTEIVIHFCNYYLGIYMTKYDISISHRQPIEADRLKFKEKYIPPIYCRFVNRKLAHNILERRHLLRNARNFRNERFFIKENLTLQKRLLRDRARSELTSYRFQWVKNGSIFVKKDSYSRPIRLNSEACLEKLLHEQNRTPTGVLTCHRESFVNALKKQKSLNNQFNFDRVAPILKNSTDFPVFNYQTDFPPLPILNRQPAT